MEYAPRPWTNAREQQVDDMLAAMCAPVPEGPWQAPQPHFGIHGQRKISPTLDDALAVDSVYPPPRKEPHAG
ncbi:hypothetical protein AB0B15_03455 [Streptomyces sp. NPDC045456]|uniref:hypothetical protein n=1 Tax=Streptomyces sp. NPDC045456 TaxID=3155254 RepID=UPI003406DCD3